MFQTAHGENEKHTDLAKTLNNSGQEYTIHGVFTQAKKYKDALNMHIDIYGSGAMNLEMAGTITNLGSLFKRTGNVDTFREMYEGALDIYRYVHGEEAKNSYILKTLSELYSLNNATPGFCSAFVFL